MYKEITHKDFLDRGFNGDINSLPFSAYLVLIDSIEEYKKNAPLKWKKWNYNRINKKKSLRQKG